MLTILNNPNRAGSIVLIVMFAIFAICYGATALFKGERLLDRILGGCTMISFGFLIYLFTRA